MPTTLTQAQLKTRLRYSIMAAFSTDARLTTADTNYGNMDGFDKGIERMEVELGYTDSYPLEDNDQIFWALQRAYRWALEILKQPFLEVLTVTAGPGTFPLTQIPNSYRFEIEKLDKEFQEALDAGIVPLGSDAGVLGADGGFSAVNTSATNTDDELIYP